MLVTLLGMVMPARFPHHAKAKPPMLVTLFGMVTLVRLEQLEKAKPPMLVTLFGMVMPVRLLQFAKDPLKILTLGMSVKVLPLKSRLTYLAGERLVYSAFPRLPAVVEPPPKSLTFTFTL
jgi:hypothetical protein